MAERKFDNDDAIRVSILHRCMSVGAPASVANELIKYFNSLEPVVPKCATCYHYHELRGIAECWQGAGHSGGKSDVPNDGSGYCHNHPDAKRGEHG
jgi:hypothetical protein